MSTENTSTENTILWDLPTRIFHWSLVLLIPSAWASAEFGYYDIHQWLGYTLLILVATRVLWGFVGSRHSRFADFVRGPHAIVHYLREGKSATVGHNPLGALSVLAFLVLLLAQGTTGLFNADDVNFRGPLYYAVSSEWRDALGAAHDWLFNLLLALVGLHLLAIIYYQRRGQKLLQAMWRGQAPGREGKVAPVPTWRAIALVATLGGSFYLLLQQAPPPPAFRW